MVSLWCKVCNTVIFYGDINNYEMMSSSDRDTVMLHLSLKLSADFSIYVASLQYTGMRRDGFAGLPTCSFMK